MKALPGGIWMSSPGTLTRLIIYSMYSIIKPHERSDPQCRPPHVHSHETCQSSRMLAYRQLAAPLAWEGTFEQNRNQPAPLVTFEQQSLDLDYEAFALKTALEDLETKNYPGVGNDMQKLHSAIDQLENMAIVRHEEDKMMALTKRRCSKRYRLQKLVKCQGLRICH